MKSDDNNKDYIINLRVSRETYDKIKNKASENRETMSNLLRKVIDDSAEIIGDLSKDILGRESTDNIVSYSKVMLVSDVACAGCAKSIKAGQTVTAGYTRQGKMKYFCPACRK